MVTKIQLGWSGLFASIDDIDSNFVLGRESRNGIWCASWYAIKTHGLFYARCRTGLMHRLILEAPNDYLVLHKNGNGLDNQRHNIKIGTNFENMQPQNVKLYSTNKTGVRGVYPYKGKWVARITRNYKVINLGTFSTFEEAVIARKQEESKYVE